MTGPPAAEGQLRHQGAVVVVEAVRVAEGGGDDLGAAEAELGESAPDLDDLFLGCLAAGHGGAVASDVAAALGRAEAEGPGGDGLADDGALTRRLVVGGGALGGLGAEHVAADGAVPDLRRDVDAQGLPLDAVEEVGEAVPVPIKDGVEHVEVDGLDASEHAHEELAVLGLAGRERVAAVAHDDGGRAVPRRAGEQARPT